MLALYATDLDRGPGLALRVLPSWLTRGPWSPDAQHGGPPAGLLTHVIESHQNPTLGSVDPLSSPTRAFMLTRVTIDLLRPVPVQPLTVSVRTIRPGKRVQLVEASLWADGEPDVAGEGRPGAGLEVARAVAMRIRQRSAATGETPYLYPPDGVHRTNAAAAVHRPAQLPAEGIPADLSSRGDGFHSRATELRFIAGNVAVPGPGVMWGRVLCPLIDTEPLRGVPLAATLADFGNAVGSTLDMDNWGYMNTDLTVSMHREPVGDWIGVDSLMQLDPGGFGQALSNLYDLDGPVGRAAASLLIVDR
jgi:hypothetical protein